MEYDPDPFMDDIEDCPVCIECLFDAGLKRFFEKPTTEKLMDDCDFCSNRECETISALAVQQLIRSRCLVEKNLAVEELSYCTAEGGYLGKTYESWELFEFAMHSVCDSFYNLMEEELNVWSLFCDYDHNLMCQRDRLGHGWREFANTIKHRSRFLFGQIGDLKPDRDPDEVSPVEFLQYFVPLGIERLRAVRTLDQGTEIYRCRVEQPHIAVKGFRDIGPPPASDAVGSNRFSPPGISMFYGGATADISAREIGWPKANHVLHTGVLRTLKDLAILDFTSLAYPAGNFDPDWIDNYHIAEFFRDFIKDLTGAIDNKRKPLDYVPTQILCEYFRYFGAFSEGMHHTLSGIKYPSSHDGTPCYVLFWDNKTALEHLELISISSTDDQKS